MITAELKLPYSDKNWSLQLLGLPVGNIETQPIKNKIWSICREHAKNLRPFLQGDWGDWMMIEFWNGNELEIKETMSVLSEKLELIITYEKIN